MDKKRANLEAAVSRGREPFRAGRVGGWSPGSLEEGPWRKVFRTVPPGGYDRMFERAEALFFASWARLEAERCEAAEHLGLLLRLPPGRRALLVRNSPRLRTWGVLERLIEASRAQSKVDPVEADALAEFALDLSDEIPQEAYPSIHLADLRARAWSCRSRCLRVRGDLSAAEDALARAYRHLLAGSRDPGERALYLEIKAEQRAAQERFGEATSLLKRAVKVFVESGDEVRACRCLSTLVRISLGAGRRAVAARAAERAVELVRPEDPALLASALADLIAVRVASGDEVSARRALAELALLDARHPGLPVPLPEIRRTVATARRLRSPAAPADPKTRLLE